MLSVLVDESQAKTRNMTKHNRKLHLMYAEDTFRDRLGCVRGTIEQKETVSCITGKPMDLQEKSRKHFNALSSTNRGTGIGALVWQSWEKSWQATVAQKKLIFGAGNRHEVGGAAPPGSVSVDRKNEDVEAVF